MKKIMKLIYNYRLELLTLVILGVFAVAAWRVHTLNVNQPIDGSLLNLEVKWAIWHAQFKTASTIFWSAYVTFGLALILVVIKYARKFQGGQHYALKSKLNHR